MTSQRLRRDRRILTVIPAAAIAAVMSFTAVAYACIETWGSTIVSVTSLEPGDAFQVSGMEFPTLNGRFQLRMSSNGPECHHIGLILGGTVIPSQPSAAQPHAISGSPGRPPHQHGDLPAPVTRIIPTNSTSGQRFLCWNEPGEQNNTASRAITII